MSDTIRLTKYEISLNRINYFFEYPKRFGRYLKQPDNTFFFVEYPLTCELQKVPVSILLVPFVANILTMSMLLNISIEVPELDKDFYNSLEDIKKAYKKMFPYLNFCFDVKVKQIVENNLSTTNTSCESLFFTGGLDATSALIDFLPKQCNTSPAISNLTLINIWGGDSCIEDNLTHNNLTSYLEHLHSQYGISYAFIRSNCREMYDERVISKFTAIRIYPWENHGWWASIAHILSMSSLLAPFTYLNGIKKHYIASSYETTSKTFDANNIDTVNAIRFASCRLLPVDTELDRTDKAEKLVDFYNRTKQTFELKVCWYNNHGKNCSHCEKCYRTILDIIVNHGDPNLYGFSVDNTTYAEMKYFLKNTFVNSGYWKPIRRKFVENAPYWKEQPYLSWILTIKFNRPGAIIKKGISVLNKFIS